MPITSDDIRNKNKNLLLTDTIPDAEVETALDEAKETVMTWLYGDFEYPIDESQLTTTILKCFKLVAASTLIKDNYSDNKEALDLARDYYKEARDDISSIKKSKEFNLKTTVIKSQTVRTITSDVDNRARDFILKLNEKYK